MKRHLALKLYEVKGLTKTSFEKSLRRGLGAGLEEALDPPGSAIFAAAHAGLAAVEIDGKARAANDIFTLPEHD
jgi:hypothetical protein